jgi:hypothetical protein
LAEWLDSSRRDPDSLLSPETWDSLVETRGRGAGGGLGLGLKPRHRPGRVLVLRVYEDGACQGRLQSGDEIVAINGMALALENSNADLRQRLRGLGGAKEITLRIERAGELMEVAVPVDSAGSLGEGVVADAVGALRRLRDVFRPLTLATFAVTESDEDRYSAQLRLRFSESPAPRPGGP